MTDELERYKRRYEREKQGRKQAEELLEKKSRELFELNKELATLAQNLESEVVERTQQLEIARDQAIRSNRVKSDFLANMSHEIRTPMNGVLGMLSLLQKTALTKQQQEYLKTAADAGKSLLIIINDILDLSKIESEKLELENIGFNLQDIIEDILKIFTYIARKKHLELFSFVDRNVPSGLMGDPTRVRQIITNLIGNAVKFTEQGGIIIKVRYTENRLIVEVVDTGIGMTPEQLDTIWQAFNQADTTTTRKYGGTGLGLSISRQLCQLMDGEISVTSEVNKGTTFTVTLPLQETSIKCLSHAIPHPAANRRCLLIDDSVIVRDIVVAQMQEWGFKTVDACATRQGALEKLQQEAAQEQPYELILLDLMLVEDYVENLAEKIRGLAGYESVKILCFSALEPTNPKQFDEVIQKPIHLREFYCTLQFLYDSESACLLGNNHQQPTEVISQFEPATVMLVDDNETNRIIAQTVLEHLGLTVVTCVDGQDAVDKVTSTQPDLILMDLQMPVMNGFQATAIIRKMPEPYGSLPIIALTANALTGDRDKSIEAGLNEHLSKPVEQEDLIKVLSLWLRPLRQKKSDQKPSSQTESSNRQPVANAPSATTHLPSTKGFDSKGIDLEDCYKRLNGNTAIIRKVFKLFSNQYSTIDQTLSGKVSSQSWEEVRSLAHALKGSSANISATELAAIASTIEEGVKSKSYHVISDQLPELKTELVSVLDAIEHQLESRH